MAALDFPASPTNGQVYQNWIYSTSKGAWQAKPMVSAKTVTSDVAPGNPANGDEWLNTLDGCLYIYYVDVDGGQWVQVKNDASFSSELGPTVDALNAGANVNYIINGAFDINQRNFTSITTSTAYGHDRWRLIAIDGTVTYSTQAFTPGSCPSDGYESASFARLTTSGQSATNTQGRIYQRIEDVRTLAGKTVTASFWAKSASGTPQVAIGFIQVFGSGGSPSSLVPIASKITLTGGTSWTRYSVTMNVPSISGKTIGTNNDHFLEFDLWTSAGSENASLSASLGVQNTTVDFWGVQVQAGSKATNFHRAASTLQGELAACQRYYFRGTYATGDPIASASGYGSTVMYAILKFPTTMRIKPSAIEYYGDFKAYGNATSVTISALSFSAASPDNARIQASSIGGIVTSGGYFVEANTAAYIGLSAEL